MKLSKEKFIRKTNYQAMKTKLPLSLLFVVIFISGIFGQEQKPRWTNYNHRKATYPQSRFVTGYVVEKNTDNEIESDFLKRLMKYARSQLVESVHVTIKSMTTTNTITENQATAEYFKQTSVSFSKVDISGLQSETYFDEEENTGYAFVFARKDNISNYYRNKIANSVKTIEQKLKTGDAFVAENDKQSALKNYYECIPVLREIEEAQTLIIAFERASIEDSSLMVNRMTELKNSISRKSKKLVNHRNLCLDDVAFILAYALKMQAGDLDKTIDLKNFTFEDTNTASVFSRRFARIFEQKLIEQGFSIHYSSNYNTKDVFSVNYPYSLTGTYWKEDDKLHLISVLRDEESGGAQASADVSLPVNWLTDNNIAYKPDNINQTVNDLNKVNNGAVIAEGGLIIDVATNHGFKNVMYKQGDTLKLYIKSNQPCYTRFIYHAADGTQVLLLDNYYISQEMVNKTIEIPKYFVCVSPFGAEWLQLNAQSKKFEPIAVVSQYGYNIITEDLDDVLTINRGFKPVDKEVKAEKTILFTTIP